MLANIAIIIILSLFAAYLFKKLQLPELLGMLGVGILLGPQMKTLFIGNLPDKVLELFFISEQVLSLSPELRNMALIVILIRAGLGINKENLRKVGMLSIRMGTVPILIEAICIILAARLLLGFGYIESAILAFTIAAVSPAIIVPGMIELNEQRLGEKRSISTMVLAGASIDVIVAITLFGIFLEFGVNKSGDLVNLLLSIPLSILIGIILGSAIGLLLVYYFKKKRNIRDTKKVLIFMAIAVLLNHLESMKVFPIASFIGIIFIGFIVLDRYNTLAKRLALKFSKVWVLAEIVLFVLIGAALDISQLSRVGLTAILIIVIGMCGRGIGVYLSLFRSGIPLKEKLFCIIAYTPKATVQAALGSVPLSAGIAEGSTILPIAVLSIVIAAPFGSILTKRMAPVWLSKNDAGP